MIEGQSPKIPAKFSAYFTGEEQIHLRDLRAPEDSVVSVDMASCFLTRGKSFLEAAEILINSERPALAEITTIKSGLQSIFAAYKKELNACKTDKGRRDKFELFTARLSTYLEDSVSFVKQGRGFAVLYEAEQLANWRLRETVVTVSKRDNGHTVIQIDRPIYRLSEAQAKEYLAIFQEQKDQPLWFQALSPRAQQWLKAKIEPIYSELQKSSEEINYAQLAKKLAIQLGTIPSGFLKVPGLANFSEHELIILDDKGKEILHSRRTRSSVASPIQLEGDDYVGERRKIADQNVEQFIESQLRETSEKFIAKWGIQEGANISVPFMLQTLLSPSRVDWARGFQDNGRMIGEKRQAVQAALKKIKSGEYSLEVDGVTVKPQLVSTNRPVNKFRPGQPAHILTKEDEAYEVDADGSTQYERVTSQCSSFLENIIKPKLSGGQQTLLTQFLKNELPKGRNVEDVINEISTAIGESINPQAGADLRLFLSAFRDYQELIKSPHTDELGHQKQLFLSALEEIMVSSMGGALTGGCMRAKDRKGMETIHVDAMLVSYAEKGKLPSYFDKGDLRDDFVNLFIDLFQTDHQRYYSSLNARGSEGLKKLDHVLPEDIFTALKKKHPDAVKSHATLSKYNAVKKPFKFSWKKALFPWALLPPVVGILIGLIVEASRSPSREQLMADNVRAVQDNPQVSTDEVRGSTMEALSKLDPQNKTTADLFSRETVRETEAGLPTETSPRAPSSSIEPLKKAEVDVDKRSSGLTFFTKIQSCLFGIISSIVVLLLGLEE